MRGQCVATQTSPVSLVKLNDNEVKSATLPGEHDGKF